MFGLFESKEAKLIREETKRTISNADTLFDKKEQKDIAKKVFYKTCKYIAEIDGLGLGPKRDEIMRNQMQEAKLERQNNVTEKKDANLLYIFTSNIGVGTYDVIVILFIEP